MVSGDDKACAEGAEWLPWAVMCQVKKGFSCHGARIPAPEKTNALITECAEKAVRQADKCSLLLAETPVKFCLEMVSRNMPPCHEGDRLLDARTREVTAESVEKAFFS
jgi:D-aminopeptidase